MEDLKKLYQIARTIAPGDAIEMARHAETAEERNFYVFIGDMNLQRAQMEYIRTEEARNKRHEQMKHFWDVGYRSKWEIETLSLLLNEFPADVIMLAHAEVIRLNKNRRDIRRVERKLLSWTRKGWNTFDEVHAGLKAERATEYHITDEQIAAFQRDYLHKKD